MKKLTFAAAALALSLPLAGFALAQGPHGMHGGHGPQAGQARGPMGGGMQGMQDSDRMAQMMREMAPMMERMKNAKPEERTKMMERMGPMMRDMMPMMQGMMAMGGGHSAHGGGTAAPADASDATKAFIAANDRMHRDMAIQFSGNPDVDFVRGMIPHHQGAIDMANVVLRYGKDEQTKKWAADIVREQQREIGEMNSWLAKNAK